MSVYLKMKFQMSVHIYKKYLCKNVCVFKTEDVIMSVHINVWFNNYKTIKKLPPHTKKKQSFRITASECLPVILT